MLRELAAELIGIFVGEKRLTISVLAIVAAVGSSRRNRQIAIGAARLRLFTAAAGWKRRLPDL